MNGIARENYQPAALGGTVQAAPPAVTVLIDRNLEAAAKLASLLNLLWSEMNQSGANGIEKAIPPRAGLDGKLLDLDNFLSDATAIAVNMRGYLTGN